MDPEARPIVCARDAAPADVDGPRAGRAAGARGRAPAVSAGSGAGPRAAGGPRLAVLPPDATVVEVRGLDRIELDDLEVGREVEVARRDDGGQLAPEDGRVRGGTPPRSEEHTSELQSLTK